MPAPDSFVDTNIFLYAISTEPSEAKKATIARQLLANSNWAWSAQVAAEFINAGTSPRRPVPLTLAEAEQWVDLWLAFPLAAIDAAIVKDAIRLASRYQISYFDAQIIAAARHLVAGHSIQRT
ncbi:MAG: PIN domain-containing protein [Planctomycetes bacterium]|nr:PIN domain-containing protein [Planctomycetota bacterium]